MSFTTPIIAGDTKKGSHVMIQGIPCRVTNVSISRMPRQRIGKIRLTGTDLFTGKKYEDIYRCDWTIHAPIVTKKEYELISFEGVEGFLKVRDDEGQERNDLRIKENWEKWYPILVKYCCEEGSAEKRCIVYTISAMGVESVYDVKQL